MSGASACTSGDFYPRPPRGGRQRQLLRYAGDDTHFYPRPPRGGRPIAKFLDRMMRLFLSTPSARRATTRFEVKGPYIRHFYPRPPRGGRQSFSGSLTSSTKISIHALREEGDSPLPCTDTGQADFYPRPPRGGRPEKVLRQLAIFLISIHALREEGDPTQAALLHGPFNFYPRPPRGGRLINGFQMAQVQLFLSTPSARRATVIDGNNAVSYEISIHALREEGDLPLELALTLICDFYPRPPRGGRRI